MSGFALEPAGGGSLILLPPGETLLGRGPLLRVSDKRVSRHHGLLENLNGQLRLKPTHLNPCFIQSSPSDDPRPLQRDSWFPLHDGDLFSLLPGRFIYRVVSVGGDDHTPRNSQMFEKEEKEEEEEFPLLPEPDVEAPPPPPLQPQSMAVARSHLQDTDGPDRSSNKEDAASAAEVEDSRGHAPPPPKRRVLPAWMLAAVASSCVSSSNPQVQSAAKGSKRPVAASTSSKRAPAKQATPTSPEEVELSEEEMPERKRRRKRSNEEDKTASSKTQPGSSRREESDESGGVAMEANEGGRGGETSTADVNGAKPVPPTSVPSESAAASVSKPRLRTPCPYGKDCYRKNPLHFQECSHPGDTDYEHEDEDEDEDGADRPECPYGTDCYRKNPLHRKEFKHTRKPASTRRTARMKTPADEEEEEEDDSFINDDSEDGGDDSDYAPPASDDSGEEDVRRLRAEAEAFVKRRRR